MQDAFASCRRGLGTRSPHAQLPRSYPPQGPFAAGAADIIARDEAAVIFVEVNARTGAEAGFPAEVGTEAKRAKFERTAIAYMAGYEETDASVRFDIISMVVIGESRAMLRHHINALSADPA